MTPPAVHPGSGELDVDLSVSEGRPVPTRWRLALGALVAVALLAGCSTTTASPPTTSRHPDPAALNVTPCNYARAWHDDPTQIQ